jgi:copper resistance protein D
MNHPLYIISTSIHIIAAIIWVGGLVFMSLMLVPALRAMGNPALTARLIQAVGKRFKWVGWICLATLLITGFINLTARGFSHASLVTREFWTSPFGETLAWKLGLFVIIVTLSLVHDFIAGPRLRTLRESNPVKANTYRIAASWMGRITLILSVIITLLAVMMVRGRPW